MGGKYSQNKFARGMHESASETTPLIFMPIWKRSKGIHWLNKQRVQLIAGTVS